MKTQTNTIKYTTKYSDKTTKTNSTTLTKTNFNSTTYKRFFLKAVSFLAIPLMTVSLLPNYALADDYYGAENLNLNAFNATHIISKSVESISAESDENTKHIIPVNLSLFHTENPEQSVLLDKEHMNRQRQMSLNIYSYNGNENSEQDEHMNIYSYDTTAESEYNLYATSIQYEGEPEHILPEPEPIQKSTYRYAGQVSLTNNERYLAYCIIAGEVGSCSYRDKLMVAECLYNAATRCKLTGCNSHTLSHVRKEYQYAGYKDFNAFKQECINCGVTYYEDIIKAVEEVFDNNNMPTDEFVLYFHSGRSSWHENAKTIKFLEDTGAHKYYALKDVPEL